MFKKSRVLIILIIFLVPLVSISFYFKNELKSILNLTKFYTIKKLNLYRNTYQIDTVLYDLRISKKSIDNLLYNYDYYENNSPVGYIESYKNRLFFISGQGSLYELKNYENSEFKKIESNLDQVLKKENFVKSMSVRSLFIDDKSNEIFISFTYHEPKTKCVGLELVTSNINNFQNLNFISKFKTKCIQYKNFSDFNEMSSGGKIIALNDNYLLFTIGDFWQKNISQDLKRDYGKVLKIDRKNYDYVVFSSGHRNQQGLTLYEDKIFASEHGPRGGDEINLITLNKNYGWPLVAYGPTYKKDYKKYYLKNHLEYEEPVFVFSPSIGISDIEFYTSDYLDRWTGDLLVASMKNNTGMIRQLNPGLSLYRLKFDKKHEKILYSEKIFLDDRIRDIEILDNGLIFLVTEEDPSLYKIDLLR